MRLSGLAAGIATFAVLEITHNLLREWTKIGPGATTLSLVPETTGALQATIGALARHRRRVRATSAAASGGMLRATREDPAAAQAVGISVHRQRLWAFTLSGALAGFAGGLLRPPARLDHDRAGLSRADVHHARDARRRRAHEPLGRGRRRARRQRARLVPRPRPRAASTSAFASTCRRARGSSSSARSWRSCSSCGRPGSPAAASVDAATEAVGEGLRRRLRRRRLALRGEPRAPRRRRGVGVRPVRGARGGDQRATACRLVGAGEVHATGIHATTDAAELPAVRLRPRRDEGHAHRPGHRGDRTRLRERQRRVRAERCRQRGDARCRTSSG